MAVEDSGDAVLLGQVVRLVFMVLVVLVVAVASTDFRPDGDRVAALRYSVCVVATVLLVAVVYLFY